MDSTRHVIDPEGDVLLVINEVPSSSHPKKDSSVSTATSTSDRNDIVDCTSSGNGQGGIEIRVSSKHLVPASRFFEEKLSSKDKTASSDGMVLLPMEVEDVDALMIVLYILRCRTGKVPRIMNLRLLCMIAKLVYKYGCLEAVEVFSSIWIHNLAEKFPWCSSEDPVRLPWCFGEDLAQWIFISWVFHYKYLFQKMTLVAVRHSAEPIQPYDLPIPQSLLDCIEQKRRNWVNKIFVWMYEEREGLLNNENCCDQCDAMHLGWLLKQLRARKLYPPPLPPYSGLSVKSLEDTLRALPDPPCD